MEEGMTEKKPDRKRISVQLFPHEEWMLEDAHCLAAWKNASVREIILAFVSAGLTQNKEDIAKVKRFNATKTGRK